MDRTMRRRAREQRLTKILLIAAAVVLFCGLFAQIAVRSQVSGQAKRVAAMQAQIRLMQADAENMQLCINQYHDLDEIGKRALAMGMEPLTDERMRVVSLPNADGNTSAQTVANVGGEEMIG